MELYGIHRAVRQGHVLWSVRQTPFLHALTPTLALLGASSKKKELNRGTKKNEAGPVPLVLDLRIAHDRVGSSTDPTLNGHLRYPNNLDQSLNDTADDKIRKYRTDYNNRPPSVVSLE